jgi:hypothetical protein
MEAAVEEKLAISYQLPAISFELSATAPRSIQRSDNVDFAGQDHNSLTSTPES